MGSKRAHGFTFVEILVAITFVAIVIPVIFQTITLSSAVAQRAERQRVALELATRQLNLVVAEESWRGGDESGDFDDDYPGFAWSTSVGEWTDSTMRTLTVTVTWPFQGEELSESLTTLVPAEEAESP